MLSTQKRAPDSRPIDAVAELEREVSSPKLFRFALDVSTFLDRDKGYSAFAGGKGMAERCREIHGDRGAIAPRTATRDLNALIKSGFYEWCPTKRQGKHKRQRTFRPTKRWRVALLTGRDQFRRDWCRYWRSKDTVAAKAFTELETNADPESRDKNGDEGEAVSTQPRKISSTETSESPTEGSTKDDSENFEGCADGCADAPPTDLEASDKPETPERSSEAPLHPRDAAAPAAPRWQVIERRRGDRAPDGPTLKRVKRGWHRDKIDGYVQEKGLYAEQSALWAAELAGNEAEKQRILDDIDRRMRAEGWRSPPDVRRRRRLNRRGEKRDPAERERAKQRLAMKVARWLEARARPGAAADFWAALMGPDAQAVFDKTVAAYRASGWEDRG